MRSGADRLLPARRFDPTWNTKPNASSCTPGDCVAGEDAAAGDSPKAEPGNSDGAARCRGGVRKSGRSDDDASPTPRAPANSSSAAPAPRTFFFFFCGAFASPFCATADSAPAEPELRDVPSFAATCSAAASSAHRPPLPRTRNLRLVERSLAVGRTPCRPDGGAKRRGGVRNSSRRDDNAAPKPRAPANGWSAEPTPRASSFLCFFFCGVCVSLVCAPAGGAPAEPEPRDVPSVASTPGPPQERDLERGRLPSARAVSPCPLPPDGPP